jgi:hypothetical protein
LQLGLKLLVTAFLGVLTVGAAGLLVILPLMLLLRAGLAAVAIGVTIVPAVFIVFAAIGVVTSSVWTIGYLTQVEQ